MVPAAREMEPLPALAAKTTVPELVLVLKLWDVVRLKAAPVPIVVSSVMEALVPPVTDSDPLPPKLKLPWEFRTMISSPPFKPVVVVVPLFVTVALPVVPVCSIVIEPLAVRVLFCVKLSEPLLPVF